MLADDAVEPVRERARGQVELAGDLRGILCVVGVVGGRRVLVPVREGRVVVGKHQLEATVADPEHVADVASVLEG